MLAQAYAVSENPKKLRETLIRTIEIKPDHLPAHIALAKLDLAEGKQQAFKTRVARLQESYPDNADVVLLAARQDSSEKNFDQAVEKLSALIEQQPSIDITMELSRNLWNMGNRQAAISNLETWVQQYPEDMNALLALANYYLRDDQRQAAVSAYKQIEKHQPDQPVMLNNVAWLLKDIDPEAGIKYAKKALEIIPGNPMVLDTLGALYLKTGEVSDARTVLEEAARKAPGAIEIQMNYVRALSATGEKQEAKRLLEKLRDSVKSEELRNLIKRQIDKL